MGYNESRLFLVTSRWQMVSEESKTKRTPDGAPVRIIHSERVPDSEGISVRPDKVRTWLEERGFDLQEGTTSYARLQWEDVEAFLVVAEDELAEVQLSFTLTKDSRYRWGIWKAFVAQLCEAWGLSLYDPERGFRVDHGELLRVLADTPAWRRFKGQFSLPSVDVIS